MSTLEICLIVVAAYVAGMFLAGLPHARAIHRLYWADRALRSWEKLLFPTWAFLCNEEGGSPKNYAARMTSYREPLLIVNTAGPAEPEDVRFYLGTCMLLWPIKSGGWLLWLTLIFAAILLSCVVRLLGLALGKLVKV